MTAFRQRWSLYHTCVGILILTYVWRLQDVFPVFSALQVVSLATLGATGLFVLLGFTRNIGATARHRVFKIVIFLVALMLASIPAGIYVSQSFFYFVNDFLKTFLLFFFVACGIRGLRNIDRVLLLNIGGAAIYCLFSIRYGDMSSGRLNGLIYYDANDLGMLVICTLPFCVYFLRRGVPLAPRLLAFAALPVLLLAFVRSGSRGAFIGLLVAGGFMLFRFTAIPRLARVTALVAAVVAMVGFGGNEYLDLMKTLLNPTADYNWVGNQDTGRMEVWKRGVGYMMRRPVLGVGVNNFYVAEGTLSERGRQQQFGVGFKWSAPHNSFVQIGAELGVFGLAAFIIVLYSAFRISYPRRAGPRNAAPTGQEALGQALAAALIGFAVTGFFLSQAYGAFLYTLLALTIAFDLSRSLEQATSLTSSRKEPARAIGRGGLLRTGIVSPPSVYCVCRSVSVCVCGASQRVIDRSAV